MKKDGGRQFPFFLTEETDYYKITFQKDSIGLMRRF